MNHLPPLPWGSKEFPDKWVMVTQQDGKLLVTASTPGTSLHYSRSRGGWCPWLHFQVPIGPFTPPSMQPPVPQHALLPLIISCACPKEGERGWAPTWPGLTSGMWLSFPVPRGEQKEKHREDLPAPSGPLPQPKQVHKQDGSLYLRHSASERNLASSSTSQTALPSPWGNPIRTAWREGAEVLLLQHYDSPFLTLYVRSQQSINTQECLLIKSRLVLETAEASQTK